MFCFWTDDVREVQPVLIHSVCHDIGGLFLDIQLAGIRDDRQIIKVLSVSITVVHVPELFFPGFGVEGFFLEGLEELRCFRETGAGVGGVELTGKVDGELPATGSAHGKTTDSDAVVVNLVVFFGVFKGFKNISFAGELEGVGVASVWMKHYRVFWGKNAFIVGALKEEAEFGSAFAPAVEPEIERITDGRLMGVCFRNDETVGLDSMVDFRDETTNDEAFLRGPGGFAVEEVVGAIDACGEHFFGTVDFAFVEDFVVFEGFVNGPVVDEDIGQEGLSAFIFALLELCDELLECVELFVEGGFVGIGDGDTKRWDAADCFRVVVTRAVGECGWADECGGEREGDEVRERVGVGGVSGWAHA